MKIKNEDVDVATIDEMNEGRPPSSNINILSLLLSKPKHRMIESLFHQRRLCRLLALLSVTTVVILVCLRPPGVVVAFVNPPTTTTAVPKISCCRQRWQQRQQQPYGYGKQVQLHFREGIDNDGNDNTETKSPRRPPASSSKQSTYVATATSSTLHDETDDSSGNPPIVSKSPPPPSRNNEKSTLRLMKARRLLEMAQITPSQRLETMQSSSSVARTRNTNDEYSFNTVVPMGSYSMRFGGFGSLEEELEQPPPPIMPQQTSSSTSRSQQQQQQSTNMYELRMADTFDSVDNLVDSQSSLLPPGGRWMTNENNGGGVSSSTNTPTIRASSQQQSRSSSSASSTTTTTTPSSSSYAAIAVAEPLVPYDPIAAEKQLFQARPCVVTFSVDFAALAKVRSLWQSVGMTIYECSPADHDRAVAMISHLPVMISAALIHSCQREGDHQVLQLAQNLASSGFRDTSRVGGGNPELGRLMAEYNRSALLQSLHRYQQSLQDIIALVENNQWQELEALLNITQSDRAYFVQ